MLSALTALLPGTFMALFFLWRGEHPDWLRHTGTLLLLAIPVLLLATLRNAIGRPLKTLSNLLAGLREGDYSINARPGRGDAMALVIDEANRLVEVMREQRLSAFEAAALLQTVMAEIDVAIFTFDHENRLSLVNRSGERLLDLPRERLLGSPADRLGLSDLLTGESPRTIECQFAGGTGRWRVSHTHIREQGRPHELLVVSDLSRELREEERLAWQRLVRVFGHELNNSLAPIKSIAGSLSSLLTQHPPPADREEDLERGMSVIASRAASLDRFLGNFARLTRLPKPNLAKIELRPLIERVTRLETRLAVSVSPSPDIRLQVDGDQLEQVLINLLRNAVDAVSERDTPEVEIGWSRAAHTVEITIIDNGPGLANTANLFVPFFTTKPQGSGIGLALSRQIVENHNGYLDLRNRTDGAGCLAIVRLPLS